jgi:predicted MFS family arabinose efflux permease
MSFARLRWTVYALAVSAFFLSFFHRVAPAALAGDLTRAFDVSGAALGALAATYFYVYALMQLPTGVLADTLGPRTVLAVGSLIAGIGSLVFAAADSIAAAAVGRTLVGLGVSVVWVCVLKIIANWFDDRRFATAAGWANVVGISGALAATAPLAWLIGIISWRTVFTGIGLISLGLAAMIAWKVRDAPSVEMTPVRAQCAGRARWYDGLAAVLRNRATWPGFWVNFGMSGTHMSFVGLWAVPYLTHVYGMSAVVASRHTSVILVGYACVTVGVAWLSDQMQRRRPVIVASALLYLACWIAWLIGVPAGWTYGIAALQGIAVSGFSLSWACAKEVNAPAFAGMATSVANVGGFLAAGILQPLVGWVLDASAPGDYRGALAVLALFGSVGLAGALFIRETRCRNIWSSEFEPEARK